MYLANSFTGGLEWRVYEKTGTTFTQVLAKTGYAYSITGLFEFDISGVNYKPGTTYLFAIRRTSGSGSYGGQYNNAAQTTYTGSSSWTERNAQSFDPYFEVWEESTSPSAKRLENGQWVDATIKRFDGTQWVVATTVGIQK